jgi:hypothetical protein
MKRVKCEFTEAELRKIHTWAGIARATTGEDTGALQEKVRGYINQAEESNEQEIKK